MTPQRRDVLPFFSLMLISALSTSPALGARPPPQKYNRPAGSKIPVTDSLTEPFKPIRMEMDHHHFQAMLSTSISKLRGESGMMPHAGNPLAP